MLNSGKYIDHWKGLRMDTESITCNHCGAPLQIPGSANYVTCNHCGSNLAVRRTASVVFTETVDKLSATTEQLASQVARLERSQKLDSLDRYWEAQQKRYMITDSEGRTRLPNETMAIVGGGVAIVFGVFWTMFAYSMSPLFSLFGVLFIVIGAVTSSIHVKKARQFTKAASRYQRERAKLLHEGADSSLTTPDQLPNVNAGPFGE
jgi:DNA-directed RNA polymerase subunit RPC12/RpoP